MQNYFELFAQDPDFEVDLAKLEAVYQVQVAKFHPDKFAASDQDQQLKAVQNTSIINTAYEVLKNPLKRANYLLELENINAFDELDTKMDTDFLLRQIELREELEAIKDTQAQDKLDDFIANTGAKITTITSEIGQNFAKNKLLVVKNLVRELKFFEQLNSEATKLLDEIL